MVYLKRNRIGDNTEENLHKVSERISLGLFRKKHMKPHMKPNIKSKTRDNEDFKRKILLEQKFPMRGKCG